MIYSIDCFSYFLGMGILSFQGGGAIPDLELFSIGFNDFGMYIFSIYLVSAQFCSKHLLAPRRYGRIDQFDY